MAPHTMSPEIHLYGVRFWYKSYRPDISPCTKPVWLCWDGHSLYSHLGNVYWWDMPQHVATWDTEEQALEAFNEFKHRPSPYYYMPDDRPCEIVKLQPVYTITSWKEIE